MTIELIWWTSLAPWELKFRFPGSPVSTVPALSERIGVCDLGGVGVESEREGGRERERERQRGRERGEEGVGGGWGEREREREEREREERERGEREREVTAHVAQERVEVLVVDVAAQPALFSGGAF